jgi:hypothetical protein
LENEKQNQSESISSNNLSNSHLTTKLQTDINDVVALEDDDNDNDNNSDDDDNHSSENKNALIEDEAEETTQPFNEHEENSEDLTHDSQLNGESLNSEDSVSHSSKDESDEENEDYEKDSFVVSDESDSQIIEEKNSDNNEEKNIQMIEKIERIDLIQSDKMNSDQSIILESREVDLFKKLTHSKQMNEKSLSIREPKEKSKASFSSSLELLEEETNKAQCIEQSEEDVLYFDYFATLQRTFLCLFVCFSFFF